MAKKKKGLRNLFKAVGALAVIGGAAYGGGAIGAAITKAQQKKKELAALKGAVDVKKVFSLKGTQPETGINAGAIAAPSAFGGKTMLIAGAIGLVVVLFFVMRK